MSARATSLAPSCTVPMIKQNKQQGGRSTCDRVSTSELSEVQGVLDEAFSHHGYVINLFSISVCLLLVRCAFFQIVRDIAVDP